MVATLRKEIIPHVEGEFARGQAFGVIYMLNSLKLRASWSNGYLHEQLRALDELSRELARLAEDLPGAPLDLARAAPALPESAALEAERDAASQKLCELIDWLASHDDSVSSDARARAEAMIDKYLNRQFRHEILTSAKPMFVEMSGGAEKG
jgi:hypothetical protein